MQNDYHINAIKMLFSDILIKSIIIFTGDECNIKVTNTDANVDICTLYNVSSILKNRFNSETRRYIMEEINSIYEKLSKYSQIQEKLLFDGVRRIIYFLVTINNFYALRKKYEL